MNRTINIRVWDKKLNRYLPNFPVAIPCSGLITERHDSDFVFEESSGYLNYDGNLIYEGDIVADAETNVVMGYITFGNGAFGLQRKDKYDWVAMQEIFPAPADWKVVGNIHERKP